MSAKRRRTRHGLEPGTRLRVTIDRLAYGGEGVARPGPDLPVVFVPRTAPGDEVDIEITETRRRHARGRVLELIAPGEGRVSPACPIYDACGGCQLMHLRAEAQRQAKVEALRGALQRIGRLHPSSWGAPLFDAELRYRNRITLRWDAAESRFGYVGVDKATVIPVHVCLLAHPLVDAAYRAAVESASRVATRGAAYRESIHALGVRAGLETGEAQVTLVVAPEAPDDLLEEWGASLDGAPLEPAGRIASVWGNFTGGTRDPIFGAEYRHLAGDSTISERIGGLTFALDPRAFFQVNTRAAGKLYHAVREAVAAREDDCILDLYSGTGGIALTLAQDAAEIVAVEAAAASVALAQRSAATNGIVNVRFHNWRVEQALKQLHFKDHFRPRTVVLNPPRAGVAAAVLKTLSRMRPHRIVYVSCNPTTLARDLEALHDYTFERLVPADLFPQTYHVEAIATLQRRPKEAQR